VQAAIAKVAGVLENILTIEVPSLTLLVNEAIAPIITNASRPQDSGIHMESACGLRSNNLANFKISLVLNRLLGL
jgi:hypothetical protein